MRRLKEDAAKTTGSNHDFGQDILPLMVAEGSKVVAHSFQDVDRSRRDDGAPYWRDVGTLDAYYNANLDLCSALPQFNLYDGNWPIYTLRHNDPPAKTVLSGDDGPSSQVVDSMLCNGSIVSGSRVQRSILSNRVHTGADAEIMDSILMSGVKIGEGAVIHRAIIDKWTVVPPGAQIGVNLDEDRQRFTVTESGIVCVPTGTECDPRGRVGDQQTPSDSDFAGV